jgi:exopolysaccharide biosynthesis protein
MGCSVYEVGEFLRHFGASDALNMDGGGSTTLIFQNNGKITKMNHYRNGAERTVGASLGVIID